jgi:2-polyprenyl-3-methyl-5-hydroxy-6-metoxy-1,4-benzoquinol methylase
MQHYRPYICPFERLLPHIPQRATVLDIGCGSGLLLALAASSGLDIRGVGVDTSEPAIAIAQLLGLRGVEFQQSWPEGLFDVVTMVDVLHHVPPAEQRHFFQRAAAKVAPGGKLIYKDMAERPWWRAAANRIHDLAVAREWIHYVPIARVQEWACAEAFECDAEADITRLWYAHQLRVFLRGAG